MDPGGEAKDHHLSLWSRQFCHDIKVTKVKTLFATEGTREFLVNIPNDLRLRSNGRYSVRMRDT